MKIRADNILREYNPPPVVTSPSSPGLAAATRTSLATANSVSCLISEKCQQVARDKLPPDSEELSCDSPTLESGYFRCVCAKTRFLGHNDYFSAHCVFQECKDDREKRAFVKQYKDGCKQIGESLADIPKEWIPFTKPDASSSSQRSHQSTTRSTPLASDAPSTSTAPSATTDPTQSSTVAEADVVPAPTYSSSKEIQSPTPSSSSAAAILPTPQNTPNTAVIAGSIVATVVIVTLLIGVGKLYYDTRKKAKQLRVANAQLEDATNPDGVSNRIVTLMAGSDRASVASRSSSATDPRHTAAFPNGNTAVCNGEMEAVGAAAAAQSSVSGDYTEEYYGSNKYDHGFASEYTGYSAESGGGVVRGSYDGGVGAERRFSGVSESDYGSVRF
ncbi:hypothetical protein COCC4DRAFT_61382 [Bipolaris maydis ATCC 48331]|uniref:Uncharacterized protein n=2 Tax=Cochliobolus heterostrophus TaxID=5016 RepID=M2UYI4_COCH5|nr:uncharacterized protein COCC4DRAFT_61382 [Bipolaris maydis ATCC 48331]EMD92843.1 hypothetical protein COCHEDRAFT_1212656 [Bipolaris maydis C5]KAJ5026078.1 hypothetical protein J3E73DRAFT_412580 [Bipolaris maydis]ENI04768.1 hypothetical protein COCC4DRAFT_61382 [Bipolaris maydis ATCC 48331]KAJ6196207.1 hypothetical protein J3E72DRAFT_421332 [Bipolaris maydis]KAJ6208305.1 hypothetical protein PSV09DRAFT_1212656 [Bipolaris maydis]